LKEKNREETKRKDEYKRVLKETEESTKEVNLLVNKFKSI